MIMLKNVTAKNKCARAVQIVSQWSTFYNTQVTTYIDQIKLGRSKVLQQGIP